MRRQSGTRMRSVGQRVDCLRASIVLKSLWAERVGAMLNQGGWSHKRFQPGR